MSSLKKQGLLKVINQLNNGNINPAFTESFTDTNMVSKNYNRPFFVASKLHDRCLTGF